MVPHPQKALVFITMKKIIPLFLASLLFFTGTHVLLSFSPAAGVAFADGDGGGYGDGDSGDDGGGDLDEADFSPIIWGYFF